jgi:hypothetical protein
MTGAEALGAADGSWLIDADGDGASELDGAGVAVVAASAVPPGG